MSSSSNLRSVEPIDKYESQLDQIWRSSVSEDPHQTLATLISTFLRRLYERTSGDHIDDPRYVFDNYIVRRFACMKGLFYVSTHEKSDIYRARPQFGDGLNLTIEKDELDNELVGISGEMLGPINAAIPSIHPSAAQSAMREMVTRLESEEYSHDHSDHMFKREVYLKLRAKSAASELFSRFGGYPGSSREKNFSKKLLEQYDLFHRSVGGQYIKNDDEYNRSSPRIEDINNVRADFFIYVMEYFNGNIINTKRTSSEENGPRSLLREAPLQRGMDWWGKITKTTSGVLAQRNIAKRKQAKSQHATGSDRLARDKLTETHEEVDCPAMGNGTPCALNRRTAMKMKPDGPVMHYGGQRPIPSSTITVDGSNTQCGHQPQASWGQPGRSISDEKSTLWPYSMKKGPRLTVTEVLPGHDKHQESWAFDHGQTAVHSEKASLRPEFQMIPIPNGQHQAVPRNMSTQRPQARVLNSVPENQGQGAQNIRPRQPNVPNQNPRSQKSSKIPGDCLEITEGPRLLRINERKPELSVTTLPGPSVGVLFHNAHLNALASNHAGRPSTGGNTGDTKTGHPVPYGNNPQGARRPGTGGSGHRNPEPNEIGRSIAEILLFDDTVRLRTEEARLNSEDIKMMLVYSKDGHRNYSRAEREGLPGYVIQLDQNSIRKIDRIASEVVRSLTHLVIASTEYERRVQGDLLVLTTEVLEVWRRDVWPAESRARELAGKLRSQMGWSVDHSATMLMESFTSLYKLPESTSNAFQSKKPEFEWLMEAGRYFFEAVKYWHDGQPDGGSIRIENDGKTQFLRVLREYGDALNDEFLESMIGAWPPRATREEMMKKRHNLDPAKKAFQQPWIKGVANTVDSKKSERWWKSESRSAPRLHLLAMKRMEGGLGQPSRKGEGKIGV